VKKTHENGNCTILEKQIFSKTLKFRFTYNFGAEFDPFGIVVSIVSVEGLEHVIKGGLFR
jgi:hypothetical protein